MEEALIRKSRLLLDRLERISADSPWAHQASGVRASLAKNLAQAKPNPEVIRDLLGLGFKILEKAASEIPEESN